MSWLLKLDFFLQSRKQLLMELIEQVQTDRSQMWIALLQFVEAWAVYGQAIHYSAEN
jgi:hypothetical protein